ncbi:hypothetical protein [Nocardioides sediminis]|uniref:hypothetical protein n=1 Tax=Nocardioides sediminis TaxID=433648 RepID=UPI000D324D41|nr:hypothetical protein [Nocardioides sediminis]
MVFASSEAEPGLAVERRRPGLALLAAGLAVTPYAVCLALPYYVNGVHRRPAGETIYAHDLSTMWPYDTPLGGVVGFVAIVGIPTAPFVSIGVAMWSLLSLWAWGRTLASREVVLYVAAAAVGIASVAWLATSPANELLLWFWD